MAAPRLSSRMRGIARRYVHRHLLSHAIVFHPLLRELLEREAKKPFLQAAAFVLLSADRVRVHHARLVEGVPRRPHWLVLVLALLLGLEEGISCDLSLLGHPARRAESPPDLVGARQGEETTDGKG